MADATHDVTVIVAPWAGETRCPPGTEGSILAVLDIQVAGESVFALLHEKKTFEELLEMSAEEIAEYEGWLSQQPDHGEIHIDGFMILSIRKPHPDTWARFSDPETHMEGSSEDHLYLGIRSLEIREPTEDDLIFKWPYKPMAWA